MKDIGKFYKNGTIFIGKGFAEKIKFNNRDKVVLEYDDDKNELIIKRLDDSNSI